MKRLLTLAALATALVSTPAHARAEAKVSPAAAPFPYRAFIVSAPPGQRLSTADVRVRENGEPVTGLSVLPAGALGARLGVVLLLDTSESMTGKPIEDEVKAARSFAAVRNENEPLAILAFNSDTKTLLRLTINRRTIADALTRVPDLRLGTHIYDALDTAVLTLMRARVSAGTIVLLSDGADTGSKAAPADVVARARAAHVRVYTVGLRSSTYVGEPLQALARDSGGAYTEAAASSELSSIFHELGTRIANDYLITYPSTQGPRQKVNVTLYIAGSGRTVERYTTPPLPTYGSGEFHRSVAVRFWGSRLTMLLVALFAAGLVFLSAGILLTQPRSRTLRRRMGEFISVASADEAAQEGPNLPDRVFTGAQKGFARTRWWDRFNLELEIAEVRMPAVQIVLWTFVGTVVATWLLAVLLGGIFAVLGLAVPFVVRAVLKRKLRKTREAFADQLPDSLQVLASALRAGHSLIGALAVVVEESAEPSKREFGRIVTDEQLGVPLEEALDRVAQRMASRDLDQVSVVAELQRRTGSNSAEVLDRVTETVRERFALRRLVRGLTAQGRMSRWVLTCLPVGLLLLIVLLNPGYIHPLLHTGFGKLLLVIGAVMVTCGSLIIKRIVEIEV
ncbi:MAG TPA: VWA domain-containing protein [Gaiellaceae bacterium]